MPMADHHHSLNLLGIMDCLWFHQIIFFSQPISLSIRTTITPQPISETPPNTPSDLSPTRLLEEEISPDSSPISPQESNYKRESPRRSILLPSKLQNIGIATTLRKTMSCKSFCELEYEEIKGFMDLGFTFKKEQLSPRMMSVIPGLQRLEKHLKEQDDEVEELEEKKGVMRPYLSEAWLIKRPDSPLLNLRLPPVSATVDMKKHLRFWARTVASVIQVDY